MIESRSYVNNSSSLWYWFGPIPDGIVAMICLFIDLNLKHIQFVMCTLIYLFCFYLMAHWSFMGARFSYIGTTRKWVTSWECVQSPGLDNVNSPQDWSRGTNSGCACSTTFAWWVFLYKYALIKHNNKMTMYDEIFSYIGKFKSTNDIFFGLKI